MKKLSKHLTILSFFSSSILLPACSIDDLAVSEPADTVTVTTVQILDENEGFLAEYEVEIADDYEERQQGLMHREYLGEKSGMLFIFENGQNLSFWMKNTLIPLDIIFIGEDKRIINIEHATPCKEKNDTNCERYKSSSPALYVLEVNAGDADKFGFNLGDKIEIYTDTKTLGKN